MKGGRHDLLPVANSRYQGLKVQEAITAPGQLQDPIALPTVHGNFRDADVRVAKAAIGCAGAMRQKDSMGCPPRTPEGRPEVAEEQAVGPYRDDKGQQGDDNAIKGRLEDLQKAIIQGLPGDHQGEVGHRHEWEIWWGKKKATFEIPK